MDHQLTDPRIEAGAKAIYEHDPIDVDDFKWEDETDAYKEGAYDEIRAALEAIDIADREQDMCRVKINNNVVEKISDKTGWSGKDIRWILGLLMHGTEQEENDE